jgi:Uncharacterized conserved protein (COG2071)
MGDPTSLTSCAPAAARPLERALVFNFLIHAAAMGSMALLLLPGMPGGRSPGVADRAAYIANHPWLWRLGWLPWQITALADLLLGVALLRTSWVPRLPAILTVTMTLAAMAPDQGGQALWITRGVRLAQEAIRTGNVADYLHFESATYRLVAAWGCAGYLCGALGWTWCLAAAGTWSRRLTWLSVATWGVFAASTVILFLPSSIRPGSTLAATGNAIAFVLLQLWLIAVTERVVARSRLATVHGRYAPWRAPRTGIIHSAFNWMANSHFVRATAGIFPPPALVSQIRDVVYINYLVEVSRLKQWLPDGLELQRLGPAGQWAMLTVLIYRHGHFGPRILGPFRRFALSPVQSNWRLYVIDPVTGRRGVYFITTAISSVPYALIARLVSEGMPMHLPRSAEVAHCAAGGFRLLLDPGAGTSPNLRAELRAAESAHLPSPWSECFGGFHEMLAYCVPQDRALAPQPWYGRVARQEIELGIPLEICRRLDGRVESDALRALVGDAEPVCFHVPEVLFRFCREFYDPR